MEKEIVAPLIFIGTMIMVIWRPGRVNEAWFALGGALAALLVGLISLPDILVVTKMIWNATLSLIAIMIVAYVLEEIGFFEYFALVLARFAAGSGEKLFFMIMILSTLVTVFFNNDGTILILTPIILSMAKDLEWDNHIILPFVFAAGFLADTASVPLVVSNLVNILSADFFDLDFVDYAKNMFLPGLASIGASYALCFLYFKKQIPTQYRLENLKEPASVIKDPWLFKFGLVILCGIIIGYLAGSFFKLPVSVIATIGAGVLLYMAFQRGEVKPAQILLKAPWPIIAFAVSMYLIVFGLQKIGWPQVLGQYLGQMVGDNPWSAALGTGVLAALAASVMNNLPAAMTGALTIDQTSAAPGIHNLMVSANIIGNDIGPKMTPIGSLATLLWLYLLNQRGLKITWGYYLTRGLILTPPVLLAALVTLVLTN